MQADDNAPAAAVAATATSTVDIADFDSVAGAEEGSVMEVRNPKTNETLRHADGRPFTITFRGKDSAAFKNLARRQSDMRIQANMRTRTPVLTAVIEKDDIELIVAATMSWDVVLGGRVPPSDPREYRIAYTKYPWLKEMADEHVGVRANFIKS